MHIRRSEDVLDAFWTSYVRSIYVLYLRRVFFSYLAHYNTLLQNATSRFIIKCDKSLLQNASAFLLQNATVLLETTTVITKYADFITGCNSYCKLARLLQNASVQSGIIKNSNWMMKLIQIEIPWFGIEMCNMRAFYPWCN